jgi:ABC-type phosphate/phosphonate transport system substrate-binding protein
VIANARLYSVVPAAGECWQRLLEGLSEGVGVPLKYLEHRPPAPINELWRRGDQGAVFMCGLPFARSVPRPPIVAAPVPLSASFQGRPQYWSDLVVRADSDFQTLEDTFGHRLALTTMDSQPGCLALLYHLMAAASAAGDHRSLYQRVVEPRMTPLGAMTAVIDGLADVAPIDSFAFSLAQRYVPELTVQLRVVATTEPTPIPPLVASRPVHPALESAFLEAHNNSSMAPLMVKLGVSRFVRPDPDSYDVLKRRYDAAITFWQEHPFAGSVHSEFAQLATGPI